MAEKIKLIDVSKCTGCRGCQLACKQWNQMPARQTENFGSYQNPPDLQWNTWMLIRFQEIMDGDKVKWLFRKDGCMHCTTAGCMKACPSGALYKTDFGTVALNQEKCIGCKECISACPFDIPRHDAKTDKIFKCDLCYSRISAGLLPACAKACPTGTISFGDKDKMLAMAQRRVAELQKEGFKDASVYGDKFVDGTHVIYVLAEKVSAYDKLPASPAISMATTLWKDILKPLSLIASGGVLAGAFLHYVLHGPKKPKQDVTDKIGGE